MLRDGGYVIPAQSSIDEFSPMLMSEGSGQYWIYGEDDVYYYHKSLDPDGNYTSITKKLAKEIGADPFNARTWQLPYDPFNGWQPLP